MKHHLEDGHILIKATLQEKNLNLINPIKLARRTCISPRASELPNPTRGEQLKYVASMLLVLNVCMYVIVLGIGGWAMNRAIDHGFMIGKKLPAHFSPIHFPMGNAATGFFVTFALIAGVVGIASLIAGINHLRSWSVDSMPAAASAAIIAWALTLLAMGFAWKEIDIGERNSRLITMEAFMIILSATQLFYIAAIHGASSPSTRT